eukprot:scaffold1041_cov93-Skeletonema_dohrnii-CCMP3373.AAC.4
MVRGGGILLFSLTLPQMLEVAGQRLAPSLSLSLSLGTQEQIAPHQEANQLGYYLTRLSSIIGTPSVAPFKQGYQEPDYRTGGTSTDRLRSSSGAYCRFSKDHHTSNAIGHIIQSEKCRTRKGSNAILGSTSTDGLSSAL